MKKQSELKISEIEFFKLLDEKSELLFEAAQKNSIEIKENVWVPNKEWFNED